jgi:hypothetical protein
LITTYRTYGFDLNWKTIRIDEVQSSIWLVTHLSIDRFNRFVSLCSTWEGPVAAVIWVPPGTSLLHKNTFFRELDESIGANFSSAPRCQIKLLVLENSYLKTSQDRWESPLSSKLYPFNALRGAALDLVEECEKLNNPNSFLPENILVLALDVDMRPPALLSKLLSESNMERDSSSLLSALTYCVNGYFLILPALELENRSSNLNEESQNSDAPQVQTLLSTLDLHELKENLRSLSNRIQPFHIKQYPEGHGASRTSFWLCHVLSEDLLESVQPISYEEGYEPYGILSLKTLLDCGGYHRSFVGRHKDKIEFVMRLHLLGTQFVLWMHPTAFVIDWLPHPPLTNSKENVLHRILMEGLYRRSKRQLYRHQEIPWNSSSTSSTLHDSLSDPNNLCPSLPFEKLHEIFRAGKVIGEDFWKSDGAIKVHSTQPVPDVTTSSSSPGLFSILQSETARIANGIGISIPFTVHLPLRILTSLGISYSVRFPSNISWVGGSLPGLRATSQKVDLSIKLGSTEEIDGRIKWNQRGNSRFQLSGVAPKTPGFHILMNREMQFHKEVWHRIQIVFSLNGQMEALVDDVLIFSAKYLPTFLSLDGIRMSVFSHLPAESSHSSPPSMSYSDPILLNDVLICGNTETINHVPSALSSEMLQSIISKDVTVIFGPKEWHSLSPRSLSDFLSRYHYVYHLVLIIAPPISQTIVNEMISVLSSYPECNFTLHQAQNFQNPYEVRNLLAKSIQTKYTLHLNNDIFSVAGHSSWLEELVKFAEGNPQYCAIMPFLLENNLQEQNRLHVWWKECKFLPPVVSALGVQSRVNTLHAVFDSQTLRSPFENIRKRWKKQATPPRLLFLEDHCVLACTAFFHYQPLFDPSACYRREFFDLAWSIRCRGGDVGMALDSVVVYQRVQPLAFGDLPYFLHRRQDSLCYGSQIYLNQKWNISYRYDRWHEKQRYESILGVDLDLEKILGSTAAEQKMMVNPLFVQLLVCFFVAVGANRFRYIRDEERCSSGKSDWNSGAHMSDFYPEISSLDWSVLTKDALALEFHQLLCPLNFQTNNTLQNRLPNILGVLAQTDSVQIEREPPFLSNPFSGYCLFCLCWDPNLSVSTTSPWSQITSQGNVTKCPSIETIPSLIVDYVDPSTGQVSSQEAWVWVRTDLEVPVALERMSSVGKSSDYDIIFSTIESIALHLHLTVRPVTEANGTQLWQSFDLIRQQERSSEDSVTSSTLLISRLVRLSFRPLRLAELEMIVHWLESGVKESR